MRVLVLNGGSSSLKAGLFQVDGASEESSPAKPVWSKHAATASPDTPFELLQSLSGERVGAVGHRIVNGGKSFAEPVRITPEVKQALAALAPASPQHNKLEMAGVDAAEEVFGSGVPQVAVFDSAFHSTMPPEAYTFPGPGWWLEQGIRRFGFHGISHRYVSRRAARLLNRPIEQLKMVTCHLGAGCSLAAIDGGRSIETTMGFTALEGLMMATRSGSIDPGVLIYLLRTRNCTADEFDRMLNKESGLQGLVGSSDMREVIESAGRGEERARLALDVFVHRLCAGIGSMAAALGGLDALVFTGGIGENAPLVRERACRQFAFVGLRIDDRLNLQGPDRDIAAPDSKVRVLAIRTEEDWEIARVTAAQFRSASRSTR
jgi:acetate kinase